MTQPYMPTKAKTDNWPTPRWLFDQLDAEFNFTLDVAADDQNTKCRYWFTEKENGLMQSWQGHTCWCNPPYTAHHIRQWVMKAWKETRTGNTTVVMLLPAKVDQKWFHEYGMKAEVRFIQGRLSFGNADYTAPFPSMLLIFHKYKAVKMKSYKRKDKQVCLYQNKTQP